jgi:hypothetical protein
LFKETTKPYLSIEHAQNGRKEYLTWYTNWNHVEVRKQLDDLFEYIFDIKGINRGKPLKDVSRIAVIVQAAKGTIADARIIALR